MVDEVPVRRREFLAAGGLAIGITAGCTEQDSPSPSEEFQVGYGGVPARQDLESSEHAEGDDGSDGSDGDGGSGDGGNGGGGYSSPVGLPGGGSSGSSSDDSGSAYGGVGFGEGPYGGVPADTASDGDA